MSLSVAYKAESTHVTVFVDGTALAIVRVSKRFRGQPALKTHDVSEALAKLNIVPGKWSWKDELQANAATATFASPKTPRRPS